MDAPTRNTSTKSNSTVCIKDPEFTKRTMRAWSPSFMNLAMLLQVETSNTTRVQGMINSAGGDGGKGGRRVRGRSLSAKRMAVSFITNAEIIFPDRGDLVHALAQHSVSLGKPVEVGISYVHVVGKGRMAHLVRLFVAAQLASQRGNLRCRGTGMWQPHGRSHAQCHVPGVCADGGVSRPVQRHPWQKYIPVRSEPQVRESPATDHPQG
mmetsp:Transcript_30163/g.69937  ORF Transcript_30163/g.69937 Transcript_30163/m.69937 type:complete len:209 (-) Transcript_30163:664-1290(-)